MTDLARNDLAAPGGGSGQALNMYFPDAPPLVPSAQDDEFTGSVLDPKFTVWDPGGIGTWSIDTTKRMAKVTGNMAGTQRIAGLIQQLPGECASYCKVAGVFHAQDVGSLLEVGLAITGNVDAAPTTAFARSVTQYGYNNATDIGQGSRAQSWATYSTAPTEFWQLASEVRSYFRIRRSGLEVWLDSSPDGVTWYGSGNKQTIANLWGFGPCVAINDFSGPGTTTPWAAYFKFIRCFSGAGTSGFDATSIGRYL